MEISIIDSIKLPSVSISKNFTYRAFPDRSLNSLKPGDILKIIHWNLFSSSTYVITREESQRSILIWWEVNVGSGCGLSPSDSKLLSGPLLSRFMTPYDVPMPQMSSVFILHCRHLTCWWPGTFSTWLSAGMALDKLIMNNFPSLNGKIEIHDSQCNLRR